ncbi:MAG TPA: hypothetical protein PLQ49_01925 [Methanothrix sp.]|nr:hypothetical protein [Methanothrix sp.]HRW82024.1 hypothetical protein [Methanothrix sp.]
MPDKSTQGSGKGKGNKRNNNENSCVCPRCGFEIEKKTGVNCRSIKCPECRVPLMGK